METWPQQQFHLPARLPCWIIFIYLFLEKYKNIKTEKYFLNVFINYLKFKILMALYWFTTKGTNPKWSCLEA